MANTHDTDLREHLREESLGELVGDLGRDMSELVRKEIELAKVEVKQEARDAGRAGGMLGAAVLAAYLAVLLVSFALAWGLAAIVPTGLAFLIVGVLYGVAAAVLYQRGRQELKSISPVPKQTAETVKEDVAWARKQMS